MNDDEESFESPMAKLELDTSGDKAAPIAEQANQSSPAADEVPETPPLLSRSDSSSGRSSPPTIIPSAPPAAVAILEPEAFAESGKRDECKKFFVFLRIVGKISNF